jgi:hypothetical protein
MAMEASMQSAGRYSIELCRTGGFAAGVEDVITSDDNLTQANELYWHFVAVNPGRVVCSATVHACLRGATGSTR